MQSFLQNATSLNLTDINFVWSWSVSNLEHLYLDLSTNNPLSLSQLEKILKSSPSLKSLELREVGVIHCGDSDIVTSTSIELPLLNKLCIEWITTFVNSIIARIHAPQLAVLEIFFGCWDKEDDDISIINPLTSSIASNRAALTLKLPPMRSTMGLRKEWEWGGGSSFESF